MIKIGVTGGIGSGKTYVCNLLRQRGLPVYDCDSHAKRLMTESEDVRRRVAEAVGECAYTFDEADGRWTLNKPAVADWLFGDKSHAATMNSIVHPAVKEDFTQWAARQESGVVVLECAILFESGFDTTVDTTVEVYAPLPLRMKRAMERDGATAGQVEVRMRQQMPEEEKRRMADHCIVNDGESDVKLQLDELIRMITKGI